MIKEQEEYLYLICSPDKWFGEGSEENYQVNELLYNLSKTDWGISRLKNIYEGMLGIIKVSRDDRLKYILDEYDVERLQSGIYATFRVVSFNPDKKNGKVEIKILDNFYHQNRIIDKETSKEILGDKFSSQSQGYIDENIYDLVYKAVDKIEYQELPKKRKKLILEQETEVYPRDEQEKKEALILANYKCELEEEHTTFITKYTNENYVEGHHLIPISQYDEFDNDVDVRANIISLCPTCHRKLHSGIKEEVDTLIEELHSQRDARLKKVGSGITLDELKFIYSGDI